MNKIPRQLLQQAYQFLFPYTCIFCGEKSHSWQDICINCKADLPWLNNACPQCGLILAAGAISPATKCGWCQRYAPPFDTTFALWSYQQPVTQLITALKFNHQLKYARLIGELMAERLATHSLPECIIPVPLHETRLRQRGFNQSLEIARSLGKRLNVAINTRCCIRIKATEAQSSIAKKKRRENLANAFNVEQRFTAAHVALLDDVMTTGCTVKELSMQLKRQGVKRVDIWCCARTQQIS